MRIVFFGTPDFVLPVLNKLQETYTVIGVVTTPDQPVGRKKILTPSPVKQYALDHGIPVYTPEKLNDASVTIHKELKPDLFVVAAYGKIIPRKLLDIPTFGALNIHPSLLPKYRGPSPIQSALLNGDAETGITIIKMDEKMDHGPIIVQEVFPLSPRDTFASLHERMFRDASQMLITAIPDYASGKITPVPQSEEQATYCSIITKENGYFSIDNPPAPSELDRMIRAFHPWPTAWTRIPVQEADRKVEKILKLHPDGKIQLEGKKPTTIKDLLNGHPDLKEILQKIGIA